jgi:integrase
MRRSDHVAFEVSGRGPDSHLFPFHRVAIAGNGRTPYVYNVKLEAPMSPSSYKPSFETARKKAGIEKIRFYDARHSFVTRLAESPAVSDETIRQLAGHVSQRMLARYAHIRAQARRDAIAALEASYIRESLKQPETETGYRAANERERVLNWRFSRAQF